MSIKEKDFLIKYGFSEEEFKNTKIIFKDLLKIKADFEEKGNDYDDAGAGVVRKLLKFNSVHSVRYRIKDSEHLIAKIIRHATKNPEDLITLENYEDKITDLIGVRILHLFKSAWADVHKEIIDNYELFEDRRPIANHREGDQLTHLYSEKGCELKKHPAGYRSVHYLITTSPTKKKFVVEIQVRTIFEEGWGEIDHTVRYPYYMDNPLLNEFSQLLNRLAGSADEMGEFVLGLKQNLIEQEKQRQESELQLDKLKSVIDKLAVSEQERESLNKKVKELFAKQAESSSILNNKSNPYVTTVINPLAHNSYSVPAYLSTINPVFKPTNFETDIFSPVANSIKLGSPIYGINPLPSVLGNTNGVYSTLHNGGSSGDGVYITPPSVVETIFGQPKQSDLPVDPKTNLDLGESK